MQSVLLKNPTISIFVNIEDMVSAKIADYINCSINCDTEYRKNIALQKFFTEIFIFFLSKSTIIS